jgi:hypothetical protein
MSDKTYNGWTNYETWRVNLEIFDGIAWLDQFDKEMEVHDAARILKDYAIDVLAVDCNDQSIAYSYALAFLDAADFRQIAQSMYDNYKQEA